MSSNSLTGNPNTWKWTAFAVIALALAVIWRPGCRQYPPITSPEGMQLVKLLYAACNTQDLARLDAAEKQLAGLASQQKLTPKEQASFESIIALARNGDWKSAEKASYRFVQDQVGRGHPAPANAEHDSHSH